MVSRASRNDRAARAGYDAGMRLLRATGLAALLLLAAAATPAGQFEADGYVIHYNALTAGALPSAVTQRLGVGTTPRQGLVTITVLHAEAPGTVPAHVEGSARTLAGHAVPIEFRRVEDEGGETWLGLFTVPGNDTLRFDLAVTPAADGATTQRIRFQQDYVVD